MFGLGVGINDVTVYRGSGTSYLSGGNNLYFSQSAYDAYLADSRPTGADKALAGGAVKSAADLTALGWTNAQSTANPPTLVTLKDGTLGYAAHNRLQQSGSLALSPWGPDVAVTYAAGAPLGAAVVSTRMTWSAGGTHGSYQFPSGGVVVGSIITDIVRFRRISGSGTINFGADQGGVYKSIDITTGALSGGGSEIGAWSRQEADGSWVAWVTYAATNTNPSYICYVVGAGATVDVVTQRCDGYGLRDYVPTTSAAAYGVPIAFDRGATQNWLTYSNAFSNAAWATSSGGGGTATKTPNYATAPDGSLTACRFQATKGAGYGVLKQAIAGSLPNPHNSLLSVWVKSNTGAAQTIELSDPQGAYKYVTVTPQWTRVYTDTPAVGSLSGGMELGCGGVSSDASIDILIWHPQIEMATGREPGAYLSTDSTAPLYTAGTPRSQNLATGSGTQSITVVSGCVYSILHQEGGTYTLSGATTGTTTAGTTTTFVAASGTLTLTASSTPTLLQVWEGTASMAYVAGPYSEYPQLEIVHEAASTNVWDQSRDMSHANWTKTQMTVSANARGSVDGSTSMDKLVDAAGAGVLPTLSRAYTFGAAGQVSMSCVVAAGERSRILVRINDQASNANAVSGLFDCSTWTWLVKPTAYGTFSAADGLVEPMGFGCFRIGVTATSSTAAVNGKVCLQIGTTLQADGQGNYYDSGAGGSGAYVDYLQMESGPITRIIPTTSAAVSRTATQVMPPASYKSASGPQMTVIGFVPANAQGNTQILLGDNAQHIPAYLSSVSGVGRIWDATNAPYTSNAAVSGVLNVIATRYGPRGLGVCLNGGTVATSAFAGSMGAGAPGLMHDGTGGSPTRGGVRYIKLGPEPANDATLQLASSGGV